MSALLQKIPISGIPLAGQRRLQHLDGSHRAGAEVPLVCAKGVFQRGPL